VNGDAGDLLRVARRSAALSRRPHFEKLLHVDRFSFVTGAGAGGRSGFFGHECPIARRLGVESMTIAVDPGSLSAASGATVARPTE